jgi:hypothetical protein
MVKITSNSLIKEYIKKPIKIQAVLHDGSQESINAILELNKNRDVFVKNNELIIRTLEGDMLASKGDYIIKGVQGELYPCKPDIFQQSYECVEWKIYINAQD